VSQGLLILLSKIAFLIAIIGVGALLKHFGLKYISRTISILVLYILVPLLHLKIFATLEISHQLAYVVLIILFYNIFSLIFLSFLLRREINKPVKYSTILAATFQNCGFLPLPLCMIVCNDVTIVIVYVFLQIILLYPLAVLMASTNQSLGGKLKQAFIKILLTPVITFSIVGLLLNFTGATYLIPDLILKIFGILGQIGIYMSLLVVGLEIPSWKLMGGVNRQESLILVWRLGVSPILHLIPSYLLMINPIWFKQMIIESIMPPATMSVVLARIYGFSTEIISKTILISLVVSLSAIFLMMFTAVL